MKPASNEDLYGLEGHEPKGVVPRVLAFILRYPGATLLATLVLVAISGYLASRLQLVTDFAKLIPEHSPSVVELDKSEPYLGNTALLVVVIDAAGDDADQRARAAAAEIAQRLSEDPEFELVLYRFDREFFEDHSLLYMDVAELDDLYRRLDARIRKLILDENPLYVDFDDDEFDDDDGDEVDGAQASTDGDGSEEPDILDAETFKQLYFDGEAELETREYLKNEDGTTYLVLAQPKQTPADISYNKRLLARTAAQIEALELEQRFGDDLEFTFSGNYWSITEENDAVRADLSKAGVFSALLLLLVVFGYFRRLRALWTVFVPLGSGIVVMMGYVELAVGQLNTVTGFCFALFMGLSIDFAIHLMVRYDEERRRGQSVYLALVTTYRHTGRASVYAAATSAAGFLSLLAADFRGFKDFGIIAGGGILICLGMIAIQMPAIIAASLRVTSEKSFATYDADRAAQRRRLRWASPVVVVMLGVVALGAYRAKQLQWEDDFRNLRSGSMENLEVADRVRAILGRSTQPAVRLARDLDEVAALTRACNAERERRGTATTVQLCVSVADFLPDEQERKLPIIERIRELLTDDRLDALPEDRAAELRRMRDAAPRRPLTEDQLPIAIRKSFISAHGNKYLMKAYPLEMTWLASNNIEFTEELRTGDDVSATDIGPIGSSIIMADLIRIMHHDAVTTVVIALGAVLAILLLMFRSATRALACYLPLVFGLVATLGAMQLLGWRLGLFNMIVLPSLIGLGVDNNIHLVHRYHVEGRGSWPYVVRTTGGACLTAAVTTMAGFGGLLLASHQGLASIGKLAVLGITVATTVSVVLLPAAMSLIENHIEGTGFGLLPEHEFTGSDDTAGPR